MKLTPLTLSILTTSLISGVAIALAWTGPIGNPFINNAAAPVNVGVINQTKTGGFVSNGLISSGGFRVELDTMLGSSTLAPRNVLEVNGNITNTAALNANGNLIGYNLGVGSVGAQTVYGYSSICTGETSGTCVGTGGVVLGGANTSSNVNITNTGNSFFNTTGNLGIGTNSPTDKLTVSGGVLINSNSARLRLQRTGAQGPNYIDFNNDTNNPLYIRSISPTDTGALTIMTLNPTSGNVGVGTVTPANKLSVAGIIQSTAGGYIFPDGSTQTTAASGQWTTSGTNIFNSNTGNVGVGVNPSYKFHVQGIDGITAVFQGTNSSNQLYIETNQTGNYNAIGSSGTSARDLVLKTGNTENIRLTTAGNLGIGIATPISKLDVNGDTLLRGTAGASYFSSGAANYIRGNTYFNGSLVDENNGTYYLDPSGTSRVNALTADSLGSVGYLVSGNSSTANSGIGLVNTINSNASSEIFSYSDGTLYIAAGRRAGGVKNNINLYNVSCAGGCNVPSINLYADTTNMTGAATVAGNLTFGTSRSGVIGVYDPENTRPIYSMGGGYELPAGGASSNYGSFYGLAMSYNPGYGGASNNPQSKAGLEHQVLMMSNGVTQTAFGSGLWSNGIIHSATGGFKFPDGTTQTTAAGATGSSIQNQNASAQSANAWVSGNIRADGILTTGLLQVNGGANIYASTGNTHFGFAGGSLNYLRGSTIFDGILYDENNSAYFLDPAATSVTNDLRTNILYDQGDTAYYVDPAGISRVDTLRSKLYESVGTGADSGLTGARYYQWGYQEGGPWSGTYPDLVLGYHTGVKMGANSGYGGVRFYTDHPSISSTEIFSIGNGDGNVRAVNSIYATAFIYNSDETLKANIAPIQDSLDKVRRLEGYTFNWKQGGKADVGLVAQQVETVFPELVHTDSASGLKSVQYGNLVAPLIEAVKELANSFDSLATRIFNTESRQSELEKQNAVQAQQIADLQRQIKELQNK